MSDSDDIDKAIIAKLVGDTQLSTYAPDGVYWDVPASGKTRYVVISLLDETDEAMFGGRAFEAPPYLVKAVVLASLPTAVSDIRNAAARIDALLDPQPPAAPATLTIPGYALMSMRRVHRVKFTDPDEVDENIKWYQRGGHYELAVSGA